MNLRLSLHICKMGKIPWAHKVALRMKYTAYHELNKIKCAKALWKLQSTRPMCVIHPEFSLGYKGGRGGGDWERGRRKEWNRECSGT